MKITIVTDAWAPQTNGVVTTMKATGGCLEEMGHQVKYITPQDFRTVPMPTYPDIRLSLFAGGAVARKLKEFAPDAIHVSTEGPLGIAARRYCVRNNLSFTTSYHTQFPQYLRMRLPVPLSWSYGILRRFHGAAVRTLVATESQREQLKQQSFNNLVPWTRGVDTTLFKPADKSENSILSLPRPISVYMGRVAVEKNIGAFLSLQLPGSKLVIGDGPDFQELKQQYPDCTFIGYKFGEELARYLADCDVFVFPSRTDTFGLVLLEAMACGLPVAAYPVTGPIDVIQQGRTGVMDEDLGVAVTEALKLSGEEARKYAEQRSWQAASHQFFGHLTRTSGQPVAEVETAVKTA